MYRLVSRVSRPVLPHLGSPQWQLSRAFTTSTIYAGPKPLPPRPVIHENEITESFLKGTGPGGQKINKTSSAVQLKHLPTGLVVKCQETRSRSQNRKIARRILSDKIEELEKGDDARTVIKGKAIAKKKASAAKKAKRKYRKLEEGKAGATGEEDIEEDDKHDEVEAEEGNGNHDKASSEETETSGESSTDVNEVDGHRQGGETSKHAEAQQTYKMAKDEQTRQQTLMIPQQKQQAAKAQRVKGKDTTASYDTRERLWTKPQTLSLASQARHYCKKTTTTTHQEAKKEPPKPRKQQGPILPRPAKDYSAARHRNAYKEEDSLRPAYRRAVLSLMSDDIYELEQEIAAAVTTTTTTSSPGYDRSTLASLRQKRQRLLDMEQRLWAEVRELRELQATNPHAWAMGIKSIDVMAGVAVLKAVVVPLLVMILAFKAGFVVAQALFVR